MTTYELLTFLHIAAVIIWLGAGFLLGLLVFGAIQAGDRVREAGYHRDVGWLAPRLFIPASMASLLLGILLVIDGNWDLDTLWIVIGLGAWLVSFGLGFFYFKPEGERIGALVEQYGPANAEANRRIHRLNVVDRVQLVILFLAVADMVIKPTGDDTEVLIVGAGVVVTTLLFASAVVRRGPAELAPARSPDPS